MKRLVWQWVLMSSLALSACTQKIRSEAEFNRWLNDSENGLVQTKKANGLLISAKYLPAEWLTLKEVRSNGISDASRIDSLCNSYKNSRTFLLTIRPDTAGNQPGDVLYRDLNSYQEYKNRVLDLNFKINEYISLRTADGKAYQPVLHTLENTYSAVEHRSLYLVFADPQLGAATDEQELDLVFEDSIFGTGITHFVFKRADLEHIPPVDYRPADTN